MTNFVTKDDRGKPFNKLMKQLRIPYADFKLSPQNYSLIKFPNQELKFTNDITYLTDEISKFFPNEIDGFLKLLQYINDFNEVNLENKTIMAKDVVRNFIKEKSLLEMIFCPLLIYGSAWENDMDFSQFVVMFKSIYLEGFSRPTGGVRTIIDLLKSKYLGEIRYKTEVTKIITKNQKIIGVEINNSEILYADKILSSMGLPETFAKVDGDSIIQLEIFHLQKVFSLQIKNPKTLELMQLLFLQMRDQNIFIKDPLL